MDIIVNKSMKTEVNVMMIKVSIGIKYFFSLLQNLGEHLNREL